MRKGFIFDQNRCVGCGACKAGCFIENGWPVSVREIFTETILDSSFRTVTNLSMACNHCENAACMNGCPASCYTRDKLSGAVLIDEDKCIGCKYCTWNCPYDAPKFDEVRKIIVKCNFCTSRLTEGFYPACSIACPTGALSFNDLGSDYQANDLKWLPYKNLNPSIEFTGFQVPKPLRIIPGNLFDKADSVIPEEEWKIGDKWSLLAFSFIATLSVSVVASSLLKGVFPGVMTLAPLLILAFALSLFHLGRWSRAWRAVTNFPGSPLSREIFIFVLYSCVSMAAAVLRIPFLMPVSAITGLLLLVTIDSVYLFSDNRKQVYLHSGQTFSSALLLISFASGMLIPFIFIAIVKLVSLFYLLSLRKRKRTLEVLRFFRIAALILTGAILIRGDINPAGMTLILLLSGEFADRLLFYADFSPLNMKTSLENHKNESQNEKGY
jgi:Fe-S-cluster-containing dehydrogenase component/DMSO reductase anchor subunit